MAPSDVTARMAGLIEDEPSRDDDPAMPWLRRLCRAAVRHLPASGVGVSVMTDDGVRGVAAVSDTLSEELEELQFVLGEGPCVDAFATRRPVLESDVRAGTRWPGYSPAVVERGVRAVFAFPLQVGAARLGVLDVYRTQPGSLSNTALAEALCLAELAVERLLGGQETADVGHLEPHLAEALENHSEIYQAQGMLMVDLGVSLTEAMARLRAHAYTTNRRPGAVARDIVAGRLLLEDDST